VSLGAVFASAACSGSPDAGDGASATGGAASDTGGTSAQSGQAATGGTNATAGRIGTGGGDSQTGGTAPSGGSVTSGGTGSDTGGSSTKGGTSGSGGAASNGGSKATGGESGGSDATGGSPNARGKFFGNISTGDAVDTDGKVFSKYWDQITPENAGKWGSVQSSATAAFNWRTLDAIYDYTQKNNIVFKQHVFVWGSQQPSGNLTETHVKTWMTEFCKRYPNTKVIDVVNEPPPHTTPSYANNIGGGTNGTWQWIINSFKWAREACPNAVLILNDYNNIEYTNDATHFIDIAKKVKAGGAPIDAVGAQAHGLSSGQVSVATAKSMIAQLNSQTGLPVYITEFDISNSDDNAQLNLYQQYIPFFIDTSYIKGVTIWGWIYGKTWSQAAQSGLIRNGTARPAMTYLMQQLGRPAP
jgi:endo-1,4-beta-xylanase